MQRFNRPWFWGFADCGLMLPVCRCLQIFSFKQRTRKATRCIWVNYNISLTWIKAHLGMISLINYDSSEEDLLDRSLHPHWRRWIFWLVQAPSFPCQAWPGGQSWSRNWWAMNWWEHWMILEMLMARMALAKSWLCLRAQIKSHIAYSRFLEYITVK